MGRRNRPPDPYMAALWDVEQMAESGDDMLIRNTNSAMVGGRSLVQRQRHARLLDAGAQRLFVLRITQTLAAKHSEAQR